MEQGIQITRKDCLYETHAYLDWLHHWGQPKTPREETAYYDAKASIDEGETTLASMVPTLKLRMERFLEDFKNEPRGNPQIAKELESRTQSLSRALTLTEGAFSDESSAHQEVSQLILVLNKRIQALT